MKRILLPAILMAVALFASCNTTKKLYEAQEYDQVIMKAAPKACAGRASIEEIEMLAASYHQANQADHERILQLKATGQPDVWPEIYERYTSMKGREDALSCLPKEAKKSLNIRQLNIDDELKGAHNKAEAYLVAKANQLFSAGSPDDINQAKKLTKQLMRVSPENANIGHFQVMAMLRQTAELQTEFVYNDRRHPLPMGFEKAVMTFSEEELAQFPLAVTNTVHPAAMIVEVNEVSVGPNRDDAVSFVETNGAQTATVTDHVLNKTATIKATVTFIFKDPESITRSEWNILKLDDYVVNSKFDYTYSTLEGDRSACSEQTLENLKRQAIPFPTDESLLMDAAKELNNLIAKTLIE